MSLIRAAVLTLTAARLTRLVVTDEIGQWWIKDPIDRAAERWYSEQTEALRTMDGHTVREIAPEQPWWWKYRSGLDCPWCVGFWIGAGVLLLDRTAGESAPWSFARDALALNMVVAPLLSVVAGEQREE